MVGAYSLISKSKGPIRIPKRKGEARVNLKDKPWYDPTKPLGSLIYKNAPDDELYYVKKEYKGDTVTLKTLDGKKITYDKNNTKDRDYYEPYEVKGKDTDKPYYVNKSGTVKYQTKIRTTESKNMKEVYDAYDLISKTRHPMEIVYADYANYMKNLANNARININETPNLKYEAKNRVIFAKEVESLNNKLNEALKNKPKERTANRLANAELKEFLKEHPEVKGGELSKISQRLITKYRNELGSIARRDRTIDITDKEWLAIQSGAISNDKLRKILENSDPELLRQRAIPNDKKGLNTSQINRIKSLYNSNITLEQIAKKMNVSVSTIIKYLKENR